MGRRGQHRLQGDTGRFEAVAEFIYERYGRRVRYIADVAGGRGMLSRILGKRYMYDCEVIDPRGRTLKGVAGRTVPLDSATASYYDLIVGLHPDEATRAVAHAALVRPVILVPCCNFWSKEKLGRDRLIEAIESFYNVNGIRSERVVFGFQGPHNIGLVSNPVRL